jgi:hypothetical protein
MCTCVHGSCQRPLAGYDDAMAPPPPTHVWSRTRPPSSDMTSQMGQTGLGRASGCVQRVGKVAQTVHPQSRRGVQATASVQRAACSVQPDEDKSEMYFYARNRARNVAREVGTWRERDRRRTVPAAATRLGWERKRQRQRQTLVAHWLRLFRGLLRGVNRKVSV